VALLVLLPIAGINVPLPIIGLILGVLFIKDVLIAPYVLRGSLEEKPLAGPEALTGKEAAVVEELNPEGIVKLNGELWRAECRNGRAARGERVVVVGIEGTKLLVERRAR